MRILYYFPDTHLGNGHLGLAKLAKKAGRSIDNLREGQFALFINTSKTAMKMLSSGGVMLYYRHPDRHRINLKTISILPKYLSSSGINYDAALREVLTKDLKTGSK